MAKRAHYFINDEQLPTMLTVEILSRAYSQSDLKGIWDTYKAARKYSRGVQEPTATHRKIAEAFRKVKDVKSIARTHKLTPQQVMYAVRRVAPYDFITN